MSRRRGDQETSETRILDTSVKEERGTRSRQRGGRGWALLAAAVLIGTLAGGAEVQGCGIQVGSGSTVTLNGNFTTDCIDVAGTLNIGGTLTLTGPVSSVEGTVNLTGRQSELVFTSFPVSTILGNGQVVGKHNDAKLTVPKTRTLVNAVTIAGQLQIVGAGSFANEGVVNANARGTLLVNVSGTLSDSEGDRWQATAPGAMLRFGPSLDDNTTSIALSGDFSLSHADAVMRIDEMSNLTNPFRTTGQLNISAGLFDAHESVTMGQDAPADPEKHLVQTGGAIAVAAGAIFTHH